jgi:outer membrane immunogenic protein
MKLSVIAAAFVASTAVFAALPAAAQTEALPSFYGNLGYTFVDGDGGNLGAITGRLGARFHKYIGAEAEAGIGVDSDRQTVGAATIRTKLKHSFAGYAVAYLPVTPQFELFARGGYGTTRLNVKASGLSVSGSDESWNYGAGGQYLFDGKNGVRAEYTRYDFGDSAGHANTWSVSYVRKF